MHRQSRKTRLKSYSDHSHVKTITLHSSNDPERVTALGYSLRAGQPKEPRASGSPKNPSVAFSDHPPEGSMIYDGLARIAPDLYDDEIRQCIANLSEVTFHD